MAEVIRNQRDHIFPKDGFHYLKSNSRHGTLIGLTSLLLLLIKLPAERVKGRKFLHLHVSTGKSFYRKLLVALYGRLFGLSVIVHWHGGRAESFFNLGINRFFLVLFNKMSKRWIVLTKSWKDYFISFISDNKITILPNSVTVKEIQPKEHQENKPLEFLFMGVLKPKKGIYDLIEGVNRLRKENDYFIVRIFGKGDVGKISELITTLRLENKVKIEDWIEGDAKEIQLCNSDVILLPSYAEGMPMCLLEGMAFGMPVIASNIKGIKDFVVHGRNGFLHESGDVDSLKNFMRSYIENRNQLTEHSVNAADGVKEFSHEKAKQMMITLYNEI